MKNKLNTLFIMLSLLLISCNGNSQNPNVLKEFYSNTDIFLIEDIYDNVLIDNRHFTIKILRDKYNENMEKYNKNEPDYAELSPVISPVTMIVTSHEYDKIVYIKKMDYCFLSFDKRGEDILGGKGNLYYRKVLSAGGSGYRQNNYLVTFEDEKLNIKQLFNTGELDDMIYHPNENEIILIRGIWGADDGGHFYDHRYKIYLYTIDDNEMNEIGETSYKYTSLSNGKSGKEILMDIYHSEPNVLKKIDVPEFMK